VDNGSPDLLRTHADRLLLTVVSQPQRSKNRALNLGLRHARGELIVLTDDDFIVEPGWLPGYAAPWGIAQKITRRRNLALRLADS
jgi:glycosyltransferase involved in cell wall biosynthesis